MGSCEVKLLLRRIEVRGTRSSHLAPRQLCDTESLLVSKGQRLGDHQFVTVESSLADGELPKPP